MSDNQIKYFRIVKAAAIAVLAAVMGIVLYLHYAFAEREAAPEIFGMTVYHTKAVNMEPAIPKGTVVLLEKPDTDSLSSGSVVLCRIEGSRVLTRIVSIKDESGGLSYGVRFDMDIPEREYVISYKDIIGRAVRQDSKLGAVLDFAVSGRGVLITAAFCCTLIFDIFRQMNLKSE